MYHMKELTALLAVAVVASFSYAQQQLIEPSSMAPSQTVASVSLWPEDLAASPAMRLAPLEVITAAGLESVGIDPLKLIRVDVFIGMPVPTGQQFGALIQSSEPIDITKLNPDMLQSDEIIDDKGFKYLVLDGPEEVIVHQLNPQTVVLGSKFFAKAMVKNADANNKVAGVLSAIKSKQDGLAVISIEMLRPLLEGLVESAPLPPNIISDLNTVTKDVNFAALRVLVGSEEKLQLVISTPDAASASKVETSIANLLAFGLDQAMVEMQLPADADRESLTVQAIEAYMNRIIIAIKSGMRPTKTGGRLVYEVNDFQRLNMAAALTGFLLPALQSTGVAARRVQSGNNLRQLGLALYNFESTYRTFPATAGVGDDGQPMLSWRVAILPFVEEGELYQKFNLDEPWDSEHNLALLEEMPDVFKHPGRNTPPGHTVYMAPVNDVTLLRKTEPSRLANVTDGTSNTIMLLETSEELAVPWTAPQDYELDMENPSAGLFVNGIFNMLLGDGSVHTVEQVLWDMDTLRAFFTRAGGEAVEFPR